MALDEALLERAVATDRVLLRTYHWDETAITIGYFSPASSVAFVRHWVRRMTGGGLVEHGRDLTFALAAPRALPYCSGGADRRYEVIHSALALSLSAVDLHTALSAGPSRPLRSPGGPAPCFARPVPADLLDGDGIKIAGGAQRRVAGAVLHQGSIRLPLPLRHPGSPWLLTFLDRLSARIVEMSEIDREWMEDRAPRRRDERYASDKWNYRC